MRSVHHLPKLGLTLFIALVALIGHAADTNAYPRITKEAFEARLPFFDYDKSIPLEGRIVQ